MELDIYIPSCKLAFEYQGKQHYEDIYSFGEQKWTLERDLDKQIGCSNLGITLITIPYWWDGSKESLISTIRQYRPDLVISHSFNFEPIPLEVPLKSSSYKEEKQKRQLQEEWDGKQSLRGW